TQEKETNMYDVAAIKFRCVNVVIDFYVSRRCKQRRPETFRRMRIGLARALFMNLTILLLDEERGLIAAAERRMMRSS
ncbi:hypothetical protein Tco_1435114, partial [Tanacetum coccineum]